MLFFISTVLSKTFYINMFTYSPQDKKIAEIIQIHPLQKFGNPWFLILCEVTWWSTTVLLFCVGCSWVPCLFWTVELSTVLQTNPPRSVDSAVFQHFCIFEPFPGVTVWFWDSIFSHWGQLMDSNTTIKKGSNILTDAPEEHTMH